MKRSLFSLCLCSVILSVPASAATRPRYGGTLRLSFSQTAETYDPALASTLAEQTVSRAVYETLVTLDHRGAPAPALALLWQPELGGKRWVFQLRSGVRFHSGALLTAAAARASLERAVSRAQGASAARLRRVQFLCASPQPNRLACDAAEPLPALPEMLSDPALAIMEVDGAAGAEVAGAGTGPFRVATWTRGASARLEAFDGYFGGRPFLDAIEAEFGSDPRRQRVEFELKRADVLVAPTTAAPLVAAAPRAPQPANLLLLGFAAAARPTDNGFRRFVLAALDRDALVRLLPPGGAEPADAFLPAWLSGYAFLFARPVGSSAPPAVGSLPRGAVRLIYDEADPVARLIASRLALDLRTAGAEARAEGLARTAFAAARAAGQYDLFLESARLRVDSSAGALADLFARYDPDGLLPPPLFQPIRAGSAEVQFRVEQAALNSLRVVPLLHYREHYFFQPGLDQVRLDRSNMLDLANSWKK